MRRILSAAFSFLIAFLAIAPAAGAQEYNHKITVYAVVPELRVIYLDQSGNIIKIAGNTTANIVPTVLDSKNRPAALSPAIQDQYDNFLRLHGGKLQASKTYNVNPVSVSTTTNSLTIEVSNTGLSLVDLTIE
jgi:hypothetical protein